MENNTRILFGKQVADSINEKIVSEITALNNKGIMPKLCIVRVGQRPDDIAYENSAVKKMQMLGIKTDSFELPENISYSQLSDCITEANKMNDVHGILLFRPLPHSLDENVIRNVIDPGKDVDGMCDTNIAKVFAGDRTGFAPCTPQAVVELLKYYEIPVQGKNVAVIGRSMVVGKPLAMLLTGENATVTICHTKTEHMDEICRKADIIVAAAGRAGLVGAEYVTSDSIVIDVGMNTNSEGLLCGDADYALIAGKVKAITPVPGGIGSITTSILARNVVRAACKQCN